MTDKLSKAIEKREERIEKHGFESDEFTLEMLKQATEHHNGEEMMVEEVRAIENTATGLHRLITADAFPFEALEQAIEDMGVVYDERLQMREMERNND